MGERAVIAQSSARNYRAPAGAQLSAIGQRQVSMGEVAAAAALSGPGTGADMRALTGVLPGPDGPLPLLILDQRPEMAVGSGPAERVNPFVSALLSMCVTLETTTTISEAPAPAPRWRLELSAGRASRLTAPDGSIIWGGECGQPRPWRALITRTERCAVLIGAIGLWPGPSERAPSRITTLLDQAAHAQELVGGLVEAWAAGALGLDRLACSRRPKRISGPS